MLDVTEPAKGHEDTLVELAAEVVSAYVSRNVVPMADLANLILDIHTALRKTSAPAEPEAGRQDPAVPIKKSVKKEQIICLECGKGFRSLKRHLGTRHDLEPADYRSKWGLDVSYPIVAPAYAEERSSLARAMGLGQKRRKTSGRSKSASDGKKKRQSPASPNE